MFCEDVSLHTVPRILPGYFLYIPIPIENTKRIAFEKIQKRIKTSSSLPLCPCNRYLQNNKRRTIRKICKTVFYQKIRKYREIRFNLLPLLQRYILLGCISQEKKNDYIEHFFRMKRVRLLRTRYQSLLVQWLDFLYICN